MTTGRYTIWRKSSRSDAGNCVEVARADDGTFGVRDSKDISGPMLEFDTTTWNAFTDGVRSGRFGR
ncbi:DUF397 domain-containing protein [Micromonospora sp. NPDC049523]|uniref:DUF397 domain-containing protein n=1 Tax=Micromonospora sp. NPDC049523 TaxID=3155921 RepID=UPI00342A2C55